MNKITFSIIGGGWRSEFYLRVAKLLPDFFEIAAICIRNESKAKDIREKYNCNIVKSIDEILSIPCDFIVNCTNKENINSISIELAKKGFPVLSETPATEQSGFDSSLKIQVAEQYHLLPMNVALQKIIDMGIIGDVNYLEIASAHDYHAMSLIRKFLKVTSEPTNVVSYHFDTKVLSTHGRYGEIDDKKIINTLQTVKIFDFGDKKAVYNFSHDMYFSPIRKKHILIRGTRGEIENEIVRYFNADNNFCESIISRRPCGDLDGFFNEDITFENKLLYRSPFKGIRISDEEEAIAMCLLKMKEYTKNHKSFYSFSDAVLDYTFYNLKQCD